MANRNTIADVINRQNNGQPLVLSATTTLHQSFQVNGSTALLTIPSPMAPIDSAAPFPSLSPDGRPFRIRLAGRWTGGEKIQVDLVQGTGLANVIGSTGLAAGGATADNFLLEAECLWDSTSTNLRCFTEGFIGGVAVVQASVTSLIQPANAAALQFNAALTIATANANAVVYLTEFSAEMV